MELKVKRLTDTAKLPTKAYESDAGWDIYADEDVVIYPGQTVKVKTGIAVQIDQIFNTAHETVVHAIWDRSGIGSKGIHRLAGVIDISYGGEILVCLTNLNTHNLFNSIILFAGDKELSDRLEAEMNRNAFKINKGDKIAQVLTQKVSKVVINEIMELQETARGTSGFGSSGM